MNLAVVIGSTGGIGGALFDALEADGTFDAVVGLSRRTTPNINLLDEATIATAAAFVAERGTPKLIVDATGMLADATAAPEKAMRAIDPDAMARLFAVNAIGPALLMKHFLPLLPREGTALFATLSAKVGSISDNRLGGWYSYRASKAALNQLVCTAAIELGRTHPQAICVAIHPGTVATSLSAPFAKQGLDVLAPAEAARDMLAGLARLRARDSGGFFDRHGQRLPY
ncbi:SDR family NAD(P)-dependent oxidoreductase [Mesorhizobium microcysteis]|uniref:SDR family NAD(P)-dependent oxidoreductase n=1 Tax=Neoaquamicrobium microcysteis TaxID=2682781 RepID=A0A5D4GZ11_9HYPH|nr:SDR family NAD(P)-dependent oxidoreductase [Mesorhizobium microcysteis]TYR33243.1 SDR family NAD(P)-dependent oxidoreductase [Mesorhizobium microcysteis]